MSYSLCVSESYGHMIVVPHSHGITWSHSHSLMVSVTHGHLVMVPRCLILVVSVYQSLNDPPSYDYMVSWLMVSMAHYIILGISWSHGLMVSQSVCLIVSVS